MASSNGSSRVFRRRRFERARRGATLFLLALLPALLDANPLPDYLRVALAAFSPNPPPGWAYTIATTRDETRMVERHDPSRAPADRWRLLEWQHREPTADELEKYARSRPRGDSGGMQANFSREDIEPGSLRLLREDAAQAEWTAGFRESSTEADRMLAHLTLHLSVQKQRPHVSAFVLELKEPYSPVLGVKMLQLRTETRFAAPIDGRPPLPVFHSSTFAGRIFLVPTQERLEVRFSDYAPAPTKLSR